MTKCEPLFEYLGKELHNSNIISILIDTRLSTLTINSKLPFGKTSYWIKANTVLEACKSKTKNNPKTTTSSSLPSTLVYETSITEPNEDTM